MATTKVDPKLNESNIAKKAKTYQGLTSQQLIDAYRIMFTSRRVDDREILLKRQQKVFFQISGAGHEAMGVAAAFALKPGSDWFYPYYRLNVVTQSSATGTQILQAVGCAEAGRYFAKHPKSSQKTDGDYRQFKDVQFQGDEITYVSLGDGTTSEGEFWEALNTASNRRLPVIFCVQDNEYAISVPVEVQTSGGNISRLVSGFPNFHFEEFDGTDPAVAYAALKRAAEHCRAGNGPAFVHAHVIRPYSHSLSDDERLYRPDSERQADAARDPVHRLQMFLLREGILDEKGINKIEKEMEEQIQADADRALAAPIPQPETIYNYVYSPDLDPTSAAFETRPAIAAPENATDGKGSAAPNKSSNKTMADLINTTLRDEMRRDERVIVFGEDVADASREEYLKQKLIKGKGGVFKLTSGLQLEFGSDRVFNSPLAEANIVGRATGMATRGLKPVVEIQFFDYIWPAMMQLRNEMAMMRYRSGNHWSCPMVIRVPIGGYLRGGGPYHSQSGESIFAHCPGIRIAYPSNAMDAAGLLRTAIRCDDPVLFLEHKHLYRQTYNKAEYPGKDFMIPFGKASLRHEGSDVLVVTWGALVQRSLIAAQQAEKDGLSVAVLDLRTIVPYDWDAIAAHVKRTGRVIVAHEDQMTCGFGAEIAARVAGDLFEYLDAPVKRVGALDVPVAYCPDLEEAILPHSADILRAIRETAEY